MTKFPLVRIPTVWLILAGLLMLASCGAEAPTIDPGAIIVTSTPPGAHIILNGVDTDYTTPHTLTDLDPVTYDVSVELADFITNGPDVITVDLQLAQNNSAEFTLSATGFRIESPAGARILVDGDDTGKIVPTGVTVHEPGMVILSLEIDGYLVKPEQYEVMIVDENITDIPADAFSTRSRKTVILDGFANTSCGPCPELTDNLVAMTAKPEFTSDRVLYLEFNGSWPQFSDPFFLANPEENSDRFGQYQVEGIPALYVDGVKQANPLDAAAMENSVLAALESDPGFIVDVTADLSSSSVPVTVTLTAQRDVDLTDHVLFVAIYEKEIEIDPAPGINGQTVFHHVFRDRVDTLPILGPLAVGDPLQFNLTLSRGGAAPDNYVAIAFVQHNVNLAILQAGSTTAPAPTPERNAR